MAAEGYRCLEALHQVINDYFVLRNLFIGEISLAQFDISLKQVPAIQNSIEVVLIHESVS